jgi:hypothetical protein
LWPEEMKLPATTATLPPCVFWKMLSIELTTD